MQEEDIIRGLFQKYIDGTIDRAELAKLIQYTESEENRVYWQALLEAYYSSDALVIKADILKKAIPIASEVWQRLQPQIATESTYELPKKTLLARIYPYVAAIALLVSVWGIEHYYFSKDEGQANTQLVSEDIQPGTNRATLHLSDGTSMALSEAKSGVVVGESGIAYTDGTEIIQSSVIQMATIITPRAGQYQVTLPDGSKVWLNAATTLRYPTRFDDAERRVELEGEAYFEVSKSAVPFKVQNRTQLIEVLGTQFNVMAYANEPQSKTTLVQGSVRLTATKKKSAHIGILLKPGEQVIVDVSGESQVEQVSVENYIAWKNGLIVLEHQTISEVFRQLERWYAVEFVLEDHTKLPTKTLSGEVLRDLPLSALLMALEEQTRLKFTRKGRRVMVMD